MKYQSSNFPMSNQLIQSELLTKFDKIKTDDFQGLNVFVNDETKELKFFYMNFNLDNKSLNKAEMNFINEVQNKVHNYNYNDGKDFFTILDDTNILWQQKLKEQDTIYSQVKGLMENEAKELGYTLLEEPASIHNRNTNNFEMVYSTMIHNILSEYATSDENIVLAQNVDKVSTNLVKNPDFIAKLISQYLTDANDKDVAQGNDFLMKLKHAFSNNDEKEEYLAESLLVKAFKEADIINLVLNNMDYMGDMKNNTTEWELENSIIQGTMYNDEVIKAIENTQVFQNQINNPVRNNKYNEEKIKFN